MTYLSADPRILCEKLIELVEPKIDEMSSLQCYEKLIDSKSHAPPLSPSVRWKLIVDHVLRAYDLVPDESAENLLKSDSYSVCLTYRHASPIFKDRYSFIVSISVANNGDNVAALMRKRVLTPQLRKRYRQNPTTANVLIEPELIPSLIDDNKGSDLANLMKVIGRIVHQFHKCWELSADSQPTPESLVALEDIEDADLDALCSTMDRSA